MRDILMGFIRRGMNAAGIGPLILAAVYFVLHHVAAVDSLSVHEVCMGILSLTGLAFIAGGMNVVYQIEHLPLMAAILVHGAVLYVGYLVTYLMNGWLEWGIMRMLVFTGIFVVGYLVVWVIIYLVIKSRTRRLNVLLRENQSPSVSE